MLESHRTLRLSVVSPCWTTGYTWTTCDGRPTSPPANREAPVHKVKEAVVGGVIGVAGRQIKKAAFPFFLVIFGSLSLFGIIRPFMHPTDLFSNILL